MIDFFKQNDKYLDKKSLNILEIGPGNKSLLEDVIEFLPQDYLFTSIDLLDLVPAKKNHKHIKSNFLTYQFEEKFDLIIDNLCWHEQAQEIWPEFIKKVHSLLLNDSYFIGQHAVSHPEMRFLEENLLYDEDSHQLFSQKNNSIQIEKFIPPAHKIENQFKLLNFKLIKFICPLGLKVISNRNHDNPLPTDPDLLVYWVQKSL